MLKILFIEDNEDLVFAITETLVLLGDYKITKAFDGKDGLELYHKIKPDIVISDIDMPEMNGFEVAQAIRATDKNCIIFLATALCSSEDIIKGYKIGIDEYVKKPYASPELHLRIQSILGKLTSQTFPNKAIKSLPYIGKYQFDSFEKSLYLNDQKVKLTAKEFSILEILYRNKNSIVSREQLTKELWDKDDFFSSRNLDVFISKLRKYLSDDKNVKIITVKGEGLILKC